jgi:hypothetical protein
MDGRNQGLFFISDRLILNRNGFPFAIDLDKDGISIPLYI